MIEALPKCIKCLELDRVSILGLIGADVELNPRNPTVKWYSKRDQEFYSQIRYNQPWFRVGENGALTLVNFQGTYQGKLTYCIFSCFRKSLCVL